MMLLRNFSKEYNIPEGSVHNFVSKYRKINGRNPKWYHKHTKFATIDDSLLLKIEQVKLDLCNEAIDCMNLLESHGHAKNIVAKALQEKYGWSEMRAYSTLADMTLLPLPNNFLLKTPPRAIIVHEMLLEIMPKIIDTLRQNGKLSVWFEDFKMNEIENMELLEEI